MNDEREVVRHTGGYTDMARFLEKEFGRPTSRQQVYMWWSRRGRNDFPEGWDRPTRSGGATRRFHLDEVREWYRTSYVEPAVPRSRDEVGDG